MTTNLRCDRCGSGITIDERAGRPTTCPSCGSAVAGAPGAVAHHADSSRLAARAVPWAISGLFHVGLALSLMFVAILVVAPSPPPAPLVNPKFYKQADLTGQKVGKVDPGPVTKDMPRTPVEDPNPPGVKLDRKLLIGDDNLRLPKGRGNADDMIRVLGDKGNKGGGGPNLGDGGKGGGRGGVEFIGSTPSMADDVVFVLDRSGSMAADGAFDLLRFELAKTIARLHETQRFHVIFFGEGKPQELRPGCLVDGTDESKREVAKFLLDMEASGPTLVLPALERAFAVLDPTEGGRIVARDDRRKLIFLLSDGGFEGFLGGANEYIDKSGKKHVGNEAVIAFLDEHNRKFEVRDENGKSCLVRDVQINTILFRRSEDNAAKVMRAIAAQHDGTFTHARN